MSELTGTRVTFTASDTEHAQYNGPVTIVRPLEVPTEADADVGPMFKARTDSGLEFDVFGDEITPT